jgi:tRNA uridine 5-carboxymethylaminomethyl modification enzyme
LIVTPNLDRIGFMPCNPSIGGPAKGHLVRDVDALGGEMGRAIDRTALQIRLLNTSKGPAVQSLRAQADKALYQLSMKESLETQDNLTVRQELVTDVGLEPVGKANGVRALMEPRAVPERPARGAPGDLTAPAERAPLVRVRPDP